MFGQQERLTDPRHQRLDRFRFYANRNARKGFAKLPQFCVGLCGNHRVTAYRQNIGQFRRQYGICRAAFLHHQMAIAHLQQCG
ncbi:Uncharacterised protein [Shigella sonnei]|nr:Uncharacterised protein [Shigella sonnei]